MCVGFQTWWVASSNAFAFGDGRLGSRIERESLPMRALPKPSRLETATLDRLEFRVYAAQNKTA
jgi:hypothetical protein